MGIFLNCCTNIQIFSLTHTHNAHVNLYTRNWSAEVVFFKSKFLFHVATSLRASYWEIFFVLLVQLPLASSYISISSIFRRFTFIFLLCRNAFFPSRGLKKSTCRRQPGETTCPFFGRCYYHYLLRIITMNARTRTHVHTNTHIYFLL